MSMITTATLAAERPHNWARLDPKEPSPDCSCLSATFGFQSGSEDDTSESMTASMPRFSVAGRIRLHSDGALKQGPQRAGKLLVTSRLLRSRARAASVKGPARLKCIKAGKARGQWGQGAHQLEAFYLPITGCGLEVLREGPRKANTAELTLRIAPTRRCPELAATCSYTLNQPVFGFNHDWLTGGRS